MLCSSSSRIRWPCSCVSSRCCAGGRGPTRRNWRAKSGRFSCFIGTYAFGVVLLSLIFAFTLGSGGDAGRPFLADLGQAGSAAIWSALLGGVVFNLANILLVSCHRYRGNGGGVPDRDRPGVGDRCRRQLRQSSRPATRCCCSPGSPP